MTRYRVVVVIEALDKPGTERSEVHVGCVNATAIEPLVNFARSLTHEIGKLDEAKGQKP